LDNPGRSIPTRFFFGVTMTTLTLSSRTCRPDASMELLWDTAEDDTNTYLTT